MKIGLLSDTHSFLDEQFFELFAQCDEIWHAGDIGNAEVAEKLEAFKPFRAVYGNIDGGEIRKKYPKDLIFDCQGAKIFITHIGGYPPKYTTALKKQLAEIKPDIFICGHSHILRVIGDQERKLLHINSGAAGKEGFHIIRTAMRFDIQDGKISNLQVIELGKR
jgi:hypothetical protein